MSKPEMIKRPILKKMANSIVRGEAKLTEKLCLKAIKKGLSANEVIINGLLKGMRVVSKKYEKREYFVPDVLMAARAFETGFKVLSPYLKLKESRAKGKVVLGVVQGNLQTIGKDVVATFLKATGFEVYDLGVDVPPKDFIRKVQEVHADILACSVFVTTTIDNLKRVIEGLREAGIRDKIRVMVGGAALNPKIAKEVGADAYGKDATEAVKIAEKFMMKSKLGEKQNA